VIAGGGSHTLFVTDKCELYSFGLNDSGQIGNGNLITVFQPFKILGEEKIVSAAAGWNHSIALTEDGAIFAWGNNDHGQLGCDRNVTPTDGCAPAPNPSPATTKKPLLKFKAKQSIKPVHQLTPVKLNIARHIKYLSSGMRHSAAIDSDGIVYTWGQGKFGQLGLSDTCQDVKAPTPLNAALFNNSKIIKIACGARHTIFLTEGNAVYTCGSNNYGQLGIGQKIDKCPSPTLLESLKDVIDVACGWNFSVALTKDGRLFTWGRNNYGQLGISSFEDQFTPQLVPSIIHSHRVISITCGSEHTLALTDASTVLTWGWSEHGQLGHGDEENKCFPCVVTALAGKKVVTIMSGNGFSMAQVSNKSSPNGPPLRHVPVP
jgi:alpha-tubulin suppressor-like RCC1 family protein